MLKQKLKLKGCYYSLIIVKKTQITAPTGNNVNFNKPFNLRHYIKLPNHHMLYVIPLFTYFPSVRLYKIISRPLHINISDFTLIKSSILVRTALKGRVMLFI